MIMKFKNISPVIDDNAFIAPNATIIGDTTIHKNANIWFNAVLRGDVNSIEVGENSNIQDNVCVHSNYDLKTIIGKNVTIGHNAVIHGCIIEDDVLIGMGSIILDGAVIKKGAVVAAGSVITPNKVIEENMLAMGNPFKVVKEVNKNLKDYIKHNLDEYVKLSKEYLPLKKSL